MWRNTNYKFHCDGLFWLFIVQCSFDDLNWDQIHATQNLFMCMYVWVCVSFNKSINHNAYSLENMDENNTKKRKKKKKQRGRGSEYKFLQKRSKWIFSIRIIEVILCTVSWWYGFCQLRPHTHDNTMHPNAPADVKPIALLPMTDSKPPSTIIVNRSPFAYFYWLVRSIVKNSERNETKKRREKKKSD